MYALVGADVWMRNKDTKQKPDAKAIMCDSDDVKFKNRQNDPMMIEIRKSVAPGIERIVKDLSGLMKLFYV